MGGVFGAQVNNKITAANGVADSWDMSEVISTEKRLIIMPQDSSTVFHVLLVPASDEDTEADADDMIVPPTGLDICVGRGLDKLLAYNASGSEKSLYIGAFF